MDYDLTKDQKLIQSSVREFLNKECPPDKVRKIDRDEKGFDPDLWQKMAELGWLGIPFPEEYEGTGGDFFDLMIVMEEMGYFAYPGPFFSTVVLGGLTILHAGNEEQKRFYLPRVASGELFLTLAVSEAGGTYDATAVQVAATYEGGEYVLKGSKLFVPNAQIADHILCVARTRENPDPEEGITVFVIDTKAEGVTSNPLPNITREKQSEVILDQVHVSENEILGKKDEGWGIVEDLLSRAAVARCAEMIGGAKAVMDLALSYAKKRVQFDRPIGSFQSVQQTFADMWIGINGCRHITNRAAWKLAKGERAVKEAAIAKAQTGRMYREVAARGHQIFGAIGFTEEHDMHLYYRRAIGCDLSFGNSYFQEEKVARALGL